MPSTLTAVIVPESQVRPVLGDLSASTLHAPDAAETDRAAVLLVPDAHGSARDVLLRRVRDRGCVTGPPRPWLEVRRSYERALRAWNQGLGADTEEHLVQLVLSADTDASSDLRARALAPLGDLRPASAGKLAQTLRAWLLYQGRRDEVAGALFIHPQTVRYRMGQIREKFADRLDDPEKVLELIIALSTIGDDDTFDLGVVT